MDLEYMPAGDTQNQWTFAKALVYDVPMTSFKEGATAWTDVNTQNQFSQGMLRVFTTLLGMYIKARVVHAVEPLHHQKSRAVVGIRLWGLLTDEQADYLNQQLDTAPGHKRGRYTGILTPIVTEAEMNTLLGFQTIPPTFMESLSAGMYFTLPSRIRAFSMWEVCPDQQRFATYTTDNTTWKRARDTTNVYTECNQWVESVHRVSAYKLPHIEPSCDDLVHIARDFARAGGMHLSSDKVGAMTREQLLNFIPNGACLSSLAASSLGTPSTLADVSSTVYHACTPSDGISAHRIGCLLDTHTPVEGVPLVLHGMYNEAVKLAPSEESDIYRSDPVGTRTPSSKALMWMCMQGARALGLQPSEQHAFMLSWMRRFGVSSLKTVSTPIYVLVGDPAVTRNVTSAVIESWPSSAVVETATSSTLADTGRRSRQDLMVVVSRSYIPFDPRYAVRANDEAVRQEGGICIHARLEKQSATDTTFSTNQHVSLSRWYTLSSVIPDTKCPRVLSDAVTMVHVDSRRQSRAAHVGQFEKERKAWTKLLRFVSGHEACYLLAESLGMFPAVDDACFTLFYAMCRSVLGDDWCSPHEIEELARFARSVMIWNLVRTWHLDGLGASLCDNRDLELAFYARNRYLRMEDCCNAFVMYNQTQSLVFYTNCVVSILKANVQMTNSMTRKQFAQQEWINTTSTESSIMCHLKDLNGTVGERVLSQAIRTVLLSKDPATGVPNVKQDDEHNLCVRAVWIASHILPVEQAVISHIREQSQWEAGYTPDYKYTVYSEDARLIQKDGIPSKGITPDQCRLARIWMEMYPTANDEPIVSTPDVVITATNEDRHTPLLIHVGIDTLWTQSVTPIDEFLTACYVVAGGYEGKTIFTGAPCKDAPRCLLSDRVITVPSDSALSVTTANLVVHTPGDIALATGDADELFPASDDTLTWTRHSHIEERVARRATARTCLDMDNATQEQMSL